LAGSLVISFFEKKAYWDPQQVEVLFGSDWQGVLSQFLENSSITSTN